MNMKKILAATLGLMLAAGGAAMAEGTVDTVSIEHDYTENGEVLHIAGMSGESEVWSYDASTDEVSELTALNAFEVAGDTHMVLINDTKTGLSALDADTGAELWSIPADEAQLGAGNTFCANDGIIYITGYYGPDAPVAVDASGSILWRADPGDLDAYWPYEITATGNGVRVYYDNFFGPDSEGDTNGGWIDYDLQGQVTGSCIYNAYSRALEAVSTYEPGTAGASLKRMIAVEGMLDGLLRAAYGDEDGVQYIDEYLAALTDEQRAQLAEGYAEISETAADIVANGPAAYAEACEEAGVQFLTEDYSDVGFEQFDARLKTALSL